MAGFTKKEILILSNNASDTQALSDVLRAMGYEAIACENTDEAAGATDLIEIRWKSDLLNAKMIWYKQDKELTAYSIDITVEERRFLEAPENRRRRTLRLALVNLVKNNKKLGLVASSWGVLSGVRPCKVVNRFIDEGLTKSEIENALILDYGMEKQRADLVSDVAFLQRDYLPKVFEKRDLISIYLGYPFCPSRCSYCSFPGYDLNRWSKKKPEVISSMITEIEAVGKATKELGYRVETFYFGGGTPTAMEPEEMDELLCAMKSSFNFIDNPEWTIEGGRPDTLTKDMLETLASFPVTRLCINPQSMSQKTLDTIGRKHSPLDIEDTFKLARSFKNWCINSDIILGLPGEDINDVKDTLNWLLKLDPENITVHGLAIKRASRLNMNLSDSHLAKYEEGEAMTQYAKDVLKESGYIPYYLYRQKEIMSGSENIGWTKKGFECLYNILMIEERQTILGLGVGSATKYLEKNTWELINEYNPKDIFMYIERMKEITKRKEENLMKIKNW